MSKQMTLKQAAESVTTAEGWFRVDDIHVYREGVDTYIDDDGSDADLNDDITVLYIGNDEYKTIGE